MLTQLLNLVFGSKNDREIKALMPVVARINDLESTLTPLSDQDLVGKTQVFKQRLADGQTLYTGSLDRTVVVWDVAKAMALGADAVAIGTAALVEHFVAEDAFLQRVEQLAGFGAFFFDFDLDGAGGAHVPLPPPRRQGLPHRGGNRLRHGSGD